MGYGKVNISSAGSGGVIKRSRSIARVSVKLVPSGGSPSSLRHVRVRFTDSSHVEIKRGGDNNITYIALEIIEFKPSAIKSIQSKLISSSANGATRYTTISAINPNKATLFYSKCSVSLYDFSGTALVHSSTQIKEIRDTTAAGTNWSHIEAHVFVVEFR